LGAAVDPSSSDTRIRLVQAASRLIHAQSYANVGVKAICDEADVKKGSFYYFFESKQALALAAVEQMWQGFEENCLEPSFSAELTPRQRIERLFDYAYRTHTRIKQETGQVLGCPFGNLAAEASTLDEALRNRVLQVFAEWASVIEATIAEAIDTGELDPALSAPITSWSLLSTLLGALLIAKAANDTSCIPGIGQEAVATLWGGVAA